MSEKLYGAYLTQVNEVRCLNKRVKVLQDWALLVKIKFVTIAVKKNVITFCLKTYENDSFELYFLDPSITFRVKTLRVNRTVRR